MNLVGRLLGWFVAGFFVAFLLLAAFMIVWACIAGVHAEIEAGL